MIKVDMSGALSTIPPRVFLLEYMKSYIHYKIEELGVEAIKKYYNSMCTDGIPKDENKYRQTKGLTCIVEFPIEFYPDWISCMISMCGLTKNI